MVNVHEEYTWEENTHMNRKTLLSAVAAAVLMAASAPAWADCASEIEALKADMSSMNAASGTVMPVESEKMTGTDSTTGTDSATSVATSAENVESGATATSPADVAAQ